MNSKMIYSLAAFAIAVYAIGFMRSDFQDRQIDTVHWQLINGQLTEGPERIERRKGQHFRLIVQSNRPEQLYLQGYEKTLPLTVDKAQILELTLSKSGRFKFELQAPARQIATLAVSTE